MIRKKAFVFISIGLLLAFFRVAGSDALSVVNIERQANASAIVADASALLAPVGFSNTNFILPSGYTTLGTIKNNTNQALNLRFYMDPNITATRNTSTLYTMTMKMINSQGNTLQTLMFTGTGAQHEAPLWSGVTSIAAGATYTIQGKLTISSRTGFAATVLYGFEGVGSNGLTINLQDTAINPRRQTYTAR